ncbi:MAG TPA: NADH-quinone oxidoreductase subunit J [Bacteroidota bacterium]|nr:NADH-quinone oxidoreductase subunit J [Candidatus Kapabacteria bacterium]HRS02195.1 NADH-quinone oxidoreductase subunit J [Bacteroidota bacterium]HRT67125.1 NADH-quinone oxidoreductase subunit J [Bacteroidota bacterium]
MSIIEIVFYCFALIIVVSAMGVVFSHKLMYAAFSLLFTFFGVAGIYVLLNADFLAVVQIMIYVGGILVLIIFGIMLTTKVTDVENISGNTGKWIYAGSALVAAILFVVLVYTFNTTNWTVYSTPYRDTTIDLLGGALLTKYVLTFFMAAVLLLIAFIGAAFIAKKGK